MGNPSDVEPAELSYLSSQNRNLLTHVVEAGIVIGINPCQTAESEEVEYTGHHKCLETCREQDTEQMAGHMEAIAARRASPYPA